MEALKSIGHTTQNKFMGSNFENENEKRELYNNIRIYLPKM